MKDLIPYIPIAVFLVVGFVSGAYIDTRDPRLVRRPGGLWTPFRVFNDAEWTEEGLVARRRFLRGLGITAIAALATG